MLPATPIKSPQNFNKIPVVNFVHDRQDSAPSTPAEAQEYYNNSTKLKGYWNGSTWVYGYPMATDSQASTGTAETVTINPKQFKAGLDGKQNSLNYTPENSANKKTSMSANSTDDEYPSLKLVYDTLLTFAKLASPAFTGTPTAPTATAGDSSTKIANTEFVMTAITAAMTGALRYIGNWDTTNATDFSGLNSYRPLKAGYFFRCTGTGCVIDSVDYKAGDMIIINRDVSASTTITSIMVDKYDHTQSEDTVLLDAIQTLTNKTINASNNTISNLTLAMFATGVIATSMGATPSDLKVLTEKAISTLLALKAPLASPDLTGTPTAPTADVGTNTTQIATTAYVKAEIASMSSGHAKIEVYTNPQLTVDNNGKLTWNIAHTFGTKNIICNVYEVSTDMEITCNKKADSTTNFIVEMDSATSVAADNYRAILMGVI